MRLCQHKVRTADAIAFGLLGMGASWTLSDCIATNLPIFNQCLPGGLYLPDQLGFFGTLSQAGALSACWLYLRLCGAPTLKANRALVWLCLAVEVGGAVLVSIAWRATLDGLAWVVIAAYSSAVVVGTLSWAAVPRLISPDLA